MKYLVASFIISITWKKLKYPLMWLVKQTVVYSHPGLLFIIKTNWQYTQQFGWHWTKTMKPVSKVIHYTIPCAPFPSQKEKAIIMHNRAVGTRGCWWWMYKPKSQQEGVSSWWWNNSASWLWCFYENLFMWHSS